MNDNKKPMRCIIDDNYSETFEKINDFRKQSPKYNPKKGMNYKSKIQPKKNIKKKANKFPLNEYDNAGTKLMKRLLNAIHKYEANIVILHRDELNNKFSFSFIKYTNQFWHSNSDTISIRNLVKILGVTRNTLTDWLKFIQQTYFKPSKYNYKAGMRESILNKITARIKEVLYYEPTQNLYNYLINVIQDFENFITNNNKFQEELISIFNRHQLKTKDCNIDSKPLTKTEISRLLGMNDFYISSLGYWGEYERFSKFFNLLTRVYLIDSKELFLKKIRKETHRLVFNTLKDKCMLVQSMKSTFDIIVYSLVALSKAKTSVNRSKFVVVSYTKLSRIISHSNSKYLLNEKLKNNYFIRPIQVRRIIRELRKNYFNAEEMCRNVIIKLKIYARNNFKSQKRFLSYFVYFEELKILHLKELFNITLGLDVYKLEFITEQKNEQPHKFVRRIKRHHLDKDQKSYLVYYFDRDNEILTFKLGPFPRLSHWEIHDSHDFERDTIIINNRLKHLFQLFTYNYNPSLDYNKIFKKIFNKPIWRGLRDKVINQWIERWIMYKENDIEFYEQFYPKFYGTFKFMVKDMHLCRKRSSDCKYPDFWFWYFNTYHCQKNSILKDLVKFYK